MTAATAGRPTSGFPLLAISEVALVCTTLAATYALRRLFLPGDWLTALVLQAAVAHLMCIVLRRTGVPGGVGLLVVPVAAFCSLAALHVGETTNYGIPNAASYHAMAAMVSDAWVVFDEVKAPTEPLDGFLVACGVAVWTIALLSDWAAFRVRASIEALLPSAALLSLVAVLGTTEYRTLATALWLGAVLAFVVTRRADRLGATATWVGDRGGRGPRTLVALGASLAALSVLAAALLGPQLPGADEEAIVSLRDIGDSRASTRVTISPLVDIRGRLVNQPDVEVFTVRSVVRAYWRLTSLDRFDGRIWSSNGSFGKAEGDLAEGVDVASEEVVTDQEITIVALNQIWLPAAYEPREIAIDADVRYDEVSGTLIVDDDRNNSDLLTYSVRSRLPVHRADRLAAASTEIPEEIAEKYVALPADFSPAVRSVAAGITADAPSRYQQALALQSFFRDNFTYDLNIGPGHSENAMEAFLFDTRAGYCEQFAGSFAAMARSLGIPARVAVGFTTGTSETTDPSLYRVRGENAHAWPEVYLGEFGWVAFEPTPGRGAPFAEQYTGVPEQQAEAGSPFTATTAPETATVPDPGDTSTTTPLSSPTTQPGATNETGDTAPSIPQPTAASPWPGRLLRLALFLVAASLVYVGLVLAATFAGRQRRRRRTTDPASQVALAWDESLRSIRRAGVGVPAADTHREVVDRVVQRLPEIEAPVRSLARTAELLTYSRTAPEADVGEAAFDLADTIDRTARTVQAPVDRFKAQFHPRRLFDR